MGITAFPFTAVIDVPTARILGRDDAGTGSAEALTNTEVFAILATGTPSASTYLRGDGTWAAVSAGVGGSTGSVDNAILVASGTAGATLKATGATVFTYNGTPNVIRANVFLAANSNIMFVDAGGGAGIYAVGNGVAMAFSAQNYTDSVGLLRINNNGTVVVRSEAKFGFGPGTGLTAQIERWENDHIAFRRSTNPQKISVTNTYTSDTSFERLEIGWATNVCTIAVTAGSAGGTLRGLKIGAAATSLLGFYGVTPVDQPATITDPTGGGTIDAEARTAINTIIDRLQELGLIA